MKENFIRFLLLASCFACVQSRIRHSIDFTGKIEKVLIPTGTRHVFLDLYGASGSGIGEHSGGNGGHLQCILDVTFETEMYVNVGGQGTEVSAGYNGGGLGTKLVGGGGGGATDIRIGSMDIMNRVISVGGGGGAYAGAPGDAAQYVDGALNTQLFNNQYDEKILGRGKDAAKIQSKDVAAGGGGGGGGWLGGSAGFNAGGSGGFSYTTTCRNVQHYEEGSQGDGRATLFFAVEMFLYTGMPQPFTLPSSVQSMEVALMGARGGSSKDASGGRGAFVLAKIAVTPGQEYTAMVGGPGADSPGTGDGGFNGGGAGGRSACGGGGASDIRLSNSDTNGIDSRLVVAAGGGGCGQGSADGGDGGLPAGSTGAGLTGGPGAPQHMNTVGSRDFLVGEGRASLETGGGGGGGHLGGRAGLSGGGGGGSSHSVDEAAEFVSGLTSFAFVLVSYEVEMVASSLHKVKLVLQEPICNEQAHRGKDGKISTLCSPGNPGNHPIKQPLYPPTMPPIPKPTYAPIAKPTYAPIASPTAPPIANPTLAPKANPTSAPIPKPTYLPTVTPTQPPIPNPTFLPTAKPTAKPTCAPTFNPSTTPTRTPTINPTCDPTRTPTVKPTSAPTCAPTCIPTVNPTCKPTASPTMTPTLNPTCQPTTKPTCRPTTRPTSIPSSQPSGSPTSQPSSQPSRQPSRQPTNQPSRQPTGQPTSSPSRQPTSQPSRSPTGQPTGQPSGQPTGQPTSSPTCQPSRQPTGRPTSQPSRQPSRQPTGQPSSSPTRQPSAQPSRQPSGQPTSSPSSQPSRQPTGRPTGQPTRQPSRQPTNQPSSSPTEQPTTQPSRQPSGQPSASPSSQPSAQPTRLPSSQPTGRPSSQPSGQPSSAPSGQPTAQPSRQPSSQPSAFPSSQPSVQPSGQPSSQPSSQPSRQPTGQPSSSPSCQPSSQPTRQPSGQPSRQPSAQPSAQPSGQPTSQPSGQPSRQPSAQPSGQPSAQPTGQPTGQPSSQPSCQPSSQPTVQPSGQPSRQPSGQPSSQPSGQPSGQPSVQPSSQPSGQPSTQPTTQPSSQPSLQPSVQPSSVPSGQPSSQPSGKPTSQPSGVPTTQPSTQPTSLPTGQPSVQPSGQPSTQPSSSPSTQPSGQPSCQPTSQPSGEPTGQPSSQPTALPSAQPSSVPTMQPSTQPSTHPSGQPSAQPTSRPTSQPSSVPTGQPSSQPSRQPSAAPSSQPSRQPTAQPSSHPTGQPSGQPSRVPTSGPTSMPSASPTVHQTNRQIHSRAPSAAPTRSPTFSEAGAWTNKLQATLAEVTSNDTSAVVHRSTYFELDVLSNNPVGMFGGCTAWSNTLSSDIKPSQYTHKAGSITIKALADFSSQDIVQTYTSASATCFDPAVTAQILAAMTAPVKVVDGKTVASPFICGARSWLVRQCIVSAASSLTYAPAVCVDCADPCAVISHCGGDTGSPQLAVSPCVQTLCNAPLAAVTGLRVLSVGFTSIEVAPSIVRVSTTTTKSSVSFTAQLSASGSIYCAVYKSSTMTSALTSVNAVVLQNNVATTDHQNATLMAIQGLDAATSYTVYFLTVSPIGIKSTLDQVLLTKRVFNTACCKGVTSSLSAPTALVAQTRRNFLSVVMGALPGDRVTVQTELFSVSRDTGALSPLAQSMFPVSFQIKANSQNAPLTASLPPLPVGLYQCHVTITGRSAYEFDLAPNQQPFEVIDLYMEPPVPVLNEAVFSNDGSFVSVRFNSETNRGNTATSFACSELFSFDCAASSTCRWVDYSSLSVFVRAPTSSARCAQPGSILRLSAAAAIKAKCQSVDPCPNYKNWQHLPATSVNISAPAAALVPTVSISAPGVVGGCDDLVLDVSGSTGSGGRPWANSSVSVRSTAGSNVTMLVNHLKGLVSLMPPPSIPASLLEKGVNYGFRVTLCNFLGQCGTTNKQVLVLNDTMPMVSIAGPSLRTVTRKNVLSLSSTAFTASCDGKKSVTGLSYCWSVSSNGAQLLGLTSTSRDASRFILPAFSLLPDTFYQISLLVQAAGAAVSSSASTQVYVQRGNIVSVIEGGIERTMRIGDTFVLDASASYDEDVTGLTGAAAGLKYQWRCVQSAPVYNATCAGLFDAKKMRATQSNVFTLLATSAAAGRSVEISVLVTDASATRTASSTVSINVLSALAPLVSVSTANAPSTGVINAGQTLQLTGSLTVPVALGGNATWAVDDENINLFAIALLPLVVTIPPGHSNSTAFVTRSFSMAFPGNSLPIGQKVTFSLVGTIPYQGRQATSSVSITINAPPTPGSFVVDPSSGVELVDTFQFLALQWVDPDLPVSYLFGYVSTTGEEVVLRSRSEVAFGSSLLSSGSSYENFQVTCFAQIFDFLNANVSAQSVVRVEAKEVPLNASEIDELVRNSLSTASADVDRIKQAAAIATSLLNAVNCSQTPNCSDLHRAHCLSTAHTCGACLPGYVGEDGDSNDYCVSNGAIDIDRRKLIHFGTQQVNNDTEVASPKACPADCSGHGTCVHILQDSGALFTDAMPPCLMGTLGCSAVCDCDVDYFGTDSCGKHVDVLRQLQATRGSLISGLQSLVELENLDPQAVGGWINSLALMSLSSAELTDDSALTVLSLADTVAAAATAAAGGTDFLSSDAMKGLLASINSVAESTAKSAQRRRLSSRRRGLSVSANDVGVDPALTIGVVQSFGIAVAAGMLPGQNQVDYQLSALRVSVQPLDPVSAESDVSNSSISLPRTSLEEYLDLPQTSVDIPNTSEAQVVVVSSVRAELFRELADDLNSNPLTLFTTGTLCTSSPCFLDVVLQNSHAIDFQSLLPSLRNESVNVTCAAKEVSLHSATCPNGEEVTLLCNNTAGIVVQPCPVVHFSSVCNSLGAVGTTVLTGTESGCRMLSYSDFNVTCRCDAYQQDVSYRRLSSGRNITVPAGYSISYVSMLQATTDTFVSTILTADNLNASTVTSGWRALATLGTLAAAIVFALFWSHHSDNLAKKVGPTEEEMKNNKQLPKGTAMAKSVKKRDGRKIRFSMRGKKALVNAELAFVEESLPRALSSRTFSDRFLEEVKQHHRWFGIVFYFSDAFPRVLRVVSLATNAIVMLFIQSITYNLTNPNDGTCETFRSEAACLEPTSPFATGASKCAWMASEDSCLFIEPDSDMRIILFVAIFCAIVTTPIALLADWIVRNILSAPTKSEAVAEAEANAISVSNLAASAGVTIRASNATDESKNNETNEVAAPAPATSLRRTLSRQSSGGTALLNYMFSGQDKARDDQVSLAAGRADLRMLSMKLRKYRESLSELELEEFNLLWGLDAEGNFLTNFVEKPHGITGRLKALVFKQEEVNVKEAVLMDLRRIHDTVRAEAAALKHFDATKHAIGKKLLFLFQCDLLPGISGKILDLKGSRDGNNVPHVTRRAKILGWTFLFLMDTGMLFYIFLFALTQTGPRQNAWFQSFALWLVVEILLVSTAIVLFTHILIPSLIMKDISQIKRRLIDNIRDFNEKVQENKAGANGSALVKGDRRTDASAPFNAADYLFVSTRLAKQFPDLKEAKIISHFSTPWPRQSYLRVSNVSKKYSKKFSALTRSVSILIVFFVSNFISVPPCFQDILVQITSTTAIGYVLYIHVQLYAIFPVLVILPALVVLVVVHFIIQSSKSDAQLKLARLFPHTNKTTKLTAFTPDGAVVAEEESKNIDDDSDFDSDSISEESGPAVAMPAQAHRTRRQSINVGLNVIHALQNRVHRAESSVDEYDDEYDDEDGSSELTVTTDSAIDENEIELLHKPLGVLSAAPRVVGRGVPMFRRQSRMSSYSFDLSLPSNDEYDQQEGQGSSVYSSSRSSLLESSNESSAGDGEQDDENCTLSSDYSDGEAEEEGKETAGDVAAVMHGLTLPSPRSLSTISVSKQVPGQVNASRVKGFQSETGSSASDSSRSECATFANVSAALLRYEMGVNVHNEVAGADDDSSSSSSDETSLGSNTQVAVRRLKPVVGLVTQAVERPSPRQRLPSIVEHGSASDDSCAESSAVSHGSDVSANADSAVEREAVKFLTPTSDPTELVIAQQYIVGEAQDEDEESSLRSDYSKDGTVLSDPASAR